MRFPWLQVDMDFVSGRARMLAGLLAVPRHQALGIAIDLWAWALSVASPDAPPDGLIAGANAPRIIAAGVDWTGDPGLFVDALEGAGLATWEQGGIRLKGFDRYAKAWEKQRKDRDRKNGGAGLPKESSPTSDGIPQEKAGKTQTQIDIKASAAQESADAVPPPDSKPFALEEQQPPKRGRKDRTPSAAEKLFDDMQSLRKERCEEVGEPWVPENWAMSRRNAELGPLIRSTPEAQGRFESAFRHYLADETMRGKRIAWSVSYFMSSGVRATYETIAAREEAA